MTGDGTIRAIVAHNMSLQRAKETAGTAWMAPYLSFLLEDPFPTVRLIAERTLRDIMEVELDYSHMGTPDSWRQGRIDAITAWKAGQAGTTGDYSPELLIRSDGYFEAAKASALLAERDNRMVYLAE